MGFFDSGDSSIEYIPLTKEQKRAREFMLDLLNRGTPDIPTMGVAGLSGPEQQAQTILQQFLSKAPRGYEAGMRQLEGTLAGEYDPRTSPMYQGFREASAMDEAKAVAGLRRGAQKGGMFYSDPSKRAEGELRARYGADRSMLLGQLIDAERNRQLGAVPQIMAGGQIPAQQAGVGMQLGAVPREVDQMREQAKYNTLLQRVLFPYQQGQQTAGALWGMTPDYYIEQGGPSGFSQAMSGLGTIASLVAAPATGGLSLGGLPGGNFSKQGLSPSGKYNRDYEWGGVPAPW